MEPVGGGGLRGEGVHVDICIYVRYTRLCVFLLVILSPLCMHLLVSLPKRKKEAIVFIRNGKSGTRGLTGRLNFGR